MKLLATLTVSVALLAAGAAEAAPRPGSSAPPSRPQAMARTGECTVGGDGQLMAGRPSPIEGRPGSLGLVGLALPIRPGLSCQDTAQVEVIDDAGVPEALGPPGPVPPPPAPAWSDIDAYAAYDPQRLCAPAPLPATLALRELLVSTYPGTRLGGISRDCALGGTSEHKEGRALDWAVSVYDGDERRAAEDFLGRLLATDASGNPHALARRMGIMYLIWNGEIWSASRPGEGWRPYHGPSPHTDHVHLSLSWAGALGLTSYWRGSPDLLKGVTPDPSQLGGGVIVPRPSRAQPGVAVVVSPEPVAAPTPVAAHPASPPLPPPPDPPLVTASRPLVRSGLATPTPPPPPAVAAGPAVASPGPEAPTPSSPPASTPVPTPVPTPAPSPPVEPVEPGPNPAPTCVEPAGAAPANVPPPSSAGVSPETPAGPPVATAGPAQPTANPPPPAPVGPGVPAPPSPPPCSQPGVGTPGGPPPPSPSVPAVGTPPPPTAGPGS